jgi:hypothetical protein
VPPAAIDPVFAATILDKELTATLVEAATVDPLIAPVETDPLATLPVTLKLVAPGSVVLPIDTPPDEWMRIASTPPSAKAMVSAAGKNIPVLVSPVVVMAGAAAEPAGNVVAPLALNAPVIAAPDDVIATMVVPPLCRFKLPDVSAVWTIPAVNDALIELAIYLFLVLLYLLILLLQNNLNGF